MYLYFKCIRFLKYKQCLVKTYGGHIRTGTYDVLDVANNTMHVFLYSVYYRDQIIRDQIQACFNYMGNCKHLFIPLFLDHICRGQKIFRLHFFLNPQLWYKSNPLCSRR